MISPKLQVQLSDELHGTPRELLPEQFESIFEYVKSNEVLAAILWQDAAQLEKQTRQIMYARHIMPPDIFLEIWDEWIMSPAMTLDKICTIAIGDPESDNLRDGGLTVEQVQAITGEYLAHPEMTVDKITLLWFWATPEDIQRIGAKNIPTMSVADLSQELF